MKRVITLVICAAALFAMVFTLSACKASSSYTPEKKDPVVSTPTVGEDGKLRVGVNSSNAPFSAQVSGNIVGIDVDIAAALADEMGLTLEIVDVGSDVEGALKNGTVDIVMGIDKSDSSNTFWTSDPYLQSAVAIFASSESEALPSASSSDTKIEAQTSSLSAWEVGSQYGDSSLTSVDDLKTAFQDLANGKTKYVASDAVIGSYVCNSNGIDSSIIGLMASPSGYCVGLSSSNTDLQSAVKTALSTLESQGIIKVIEKKWLGKALDVSSVSLTENATKANSNSTESEETTSEEESTEETTTEESSDTSSESSEEEVYYEEEVYTE